MAGSNPALAFELKETKCSFPVHVILYISNPVSGGQCRLIHLTIIKIISWPSLAYMRDSIILGTSDDIFLDI